MLYFKALAFTLLSSLALIRADVDKSKCSAELQGIVFEPQTYGKDYMSKVAANFNRGKALLFTSQADSYINSFQQEWGVTVSIADAPAICKVVTVNPDCSSTTAVPTQGGGVFRPITFTFPVTDNYIISSLSVNFTGNTGGTSGTGAYSLSSPANTVVNLNVNDCFSGTPAAASVFRLGFEDGASGQIDCADLPTEVVINPIEPLSTFNGESTSGSWILTLTQNPEATITGVTLNYCQAVPIPAVNCSRDKMKALTNIPGYRYDSVTQTVYWTEDVFDAFGNFKQVTFSRPINNIY